MKKLSLMRVRLTFSCAVMLSSIMPTLALPARSIAQDVAVGSFQAYPLRHSQAADVEPQLLKLLSGLPSPPEVMADPRNNRLLVRGTDQAQQLVRQMLATLDRPSASDLATTTLKSYPCPANDLAVVARQLQTVYAGQPEVRIATDARTSQLLVLAGPEVHSQIARQVGQAADALPEVPLPAAGAKQFVPQAAAPQPTGGEAAVSRSIMSQPGHVAKAVDVSPARQAAIRSITLKHATWQQLEGSLRQLTSGRLSPLPAGDGELANYTLTLPNTADVQLSVNARTGQIELRGEPALLDHCVRLFQVLDAPQTAGSRRTRAVPVSTGHQSTVRRAVKVLTDSDSSTVATTVTGPANSAVVRPIPSGVAAQPIRPDRSNNAIPLVAKLFQNQPQPGADAPAQPGQQPPGQGQLPPGDDPAISGLVGSVQIEFLEGLDIMVISGNERDVERVSQIIADIERLSIETEPQIEVLPLEHAGSEQVAAIVTQIYDQVLSTRQGRVSITPLVKPNALLLIGRAESNQTVIDLVRQLDQPVGPASQFSVFRLKHAAATDAQATITQFYTERTGLGTRVLVTAEFRTNSLIVQASPRDMVEVAELIERIDTGSSGVVEELRVFPLRNSRADELAPVLQDAITGQGGARPGGIAGGGGGGGGGQQAAGAQSRSSMLRFATIDPQGKRELLTSGILTDVRITADPVNNALIVSGPPESMDLVSALIQQLDQIPAAESQIKVFTIVNGDATLQVQMLQSLFGQTTQAGGGGIFGGGGAQQAGFIGENPLVGLRFSVDQRTNSIIASGSAGDLNIVEAILLRLDESDMRQRQSSVYRLKNAPALAVANTINDFLRSQRDVQNLVPNQVSPFQQIEREVVVVPEQVSNSLIVSATPRYFEEIRKIVEELDARPPMVMIQVLIAEVTLNNTDEFGVELGLQDSVLFDRSLLGDLVTTSTSAQQAVAGGGTITTTTDTIQAASLTPGYNFNNQPLGNSGSTRSIASSGDLAGQALSSFAVGRVNSELGFGGLVLSASSESISILIRALKECRRLDVLSRPQIMTLDNQPAFIQVGSRVPRVQGVTQGQVGVAPVLNVIDTNVGLILGVTPRISPDGLVVMEIDAERSALGPESEGVPITTTVNGDVIRSPLINTTTAQTTVSAVDGQTVVLGGLLTKAKASTRRRVPLLSSIPILGNLFRYDLEAVQRTELLIIMTPRVVRTEADADRVKQAEAARMSWCLADVKRMHGDPGIVSRDGEWSDDQTVVIYPDQNPTLAEPIGVPPGEVVSPSGTLPPGTLPPGVVVTPPGAVPPPPTQPNWPIDTRPQVQPPPPPPPAAQPPSPQRALEGPRLQPTPDEQSNGYRPNGYIAQPWQLQSQPGQVQTAGWTQGASGPTVPAALPANMPQRPLHGAVPAGNTNTSPGMPAGGVQAYGPMR